MIAAMGEIHPAERDDSITVSEADRLTMAGLVLVRPLLESTPGTGSRRVTETVRNNTIGWGAAWQL